MKKSVILLFTFLIVLPSVYAIGIAPDSSAINFQPFLEGNLTIHVINTEKYPINATVDLKGDFTKYFNLIEEVKEIPANSPESFLIAYKFPFEVDPPGNNVVIASAKKIKSLKEKGISVVLNVKSSINIFVPYPEKYVRYSFETNNANIGENVSFDFSLINEGSLKLLDVKTYVKVYDVSDKKNHIGYYNSNSFVLPVNGEISSNILLNSSELGYGDYYLEAYVVYDGKQGKIINSNFSVGYKDVEIINHTSILNFGGIEKFDVLIKNLWNSPVDGVYLEAYLEIDNVPITERSFSHTVNFGALEQLNIPVYLDLSDLKSGNYDIVINVYYGDMIKQEKFSVNLEKKVKIGSGTIIALIIILLIILDIGWMIFETKSARIKKKVENKIDKV